MSLRTVPSPVSRQNASGSAASPSLPTEHRPSRTTPAPTPVCSTRMRRLCTATERGSVGCAAGHWVAQGVATVRSNRSRRSGGRNDPVHDAVMALPSERVPARVDGAAQRVARAKLLVRSSRRADDLLGVCCVAVGLTCRDEQRTWRDRGEQIVDADVTGDLPAVGPSGSADTRGGRFVTGHLRSVRALLDPAAVAGVLTRGTVRHLPRPLDTTRNARDGNAVFLAADSLSRLFPDLDRWLLRLHPAGPIRRDEQTDHQPQHSPPRAASTTRSSPGSAVRPPPTPQLRTLRVTSLANATGWHEAKTISERLGHANVAITIDTYSHVLPAADAATAHTLAKLILGGP